MQPARRQARRRATAALLAPALAPAVAHAAPAVGIGDQWTPAPDPRATWDSALLDRNGRPRPALAILQSWLLARSS